MQLLKKFIYYYCRPPINIKNNYYAVPFLLLAKTINLTSPKK